MQINKRLFFQKIFDEKNSIHLQVHTHINIHVRSLSGFILKKNDNQIFLGKKNSEEAEKTHKKQQIFVTAHQRDEQGAKAEPLSQHAIGSSSIQ